MRPPRSLAALLTVCVACVALALGWSDPIAAGDLRPSPDAVEYALGAASLAHFHMPEIRIGDVAAPPRYPFGFSALAAPFFWPATPGHPPAPHRAVLVALTSAVVVAVATFWTGALVFGRATGLLVALLVALSPFFQTYARLVMAEMPSAALFALIALLLALAGRSPASASPAEAMARAAPSSRSRPALLGAAIGLLVSTSITLRLANVQATPAAILSLLCLGAAGRQMWPRSAGFAGGALLALLPLLLYQAVAYGSPLTTGYQLWTPEWAGAGRPVFSLTYALQRPALPSRAAQSNAVHYASAWLGLPARGDAGEPVPSPVHPTLAGALALAALAGTWRGLRFPPARPATLFAATGALSAFAFYAPYYYQDVRYVAPWAPLWLLLAAAGLTWPFHALWTQRAIVDRRQAISGPSHIQRAQPPLPLLAPQSRGCSAGACPPPHEMPVTIASVQSDAAPGEQLLLPDTALPAPGRGAGARRVALTASAVLSGIILLALAAGIPGVVQGTPLWVRSVRRAPIEVPPRLAQARALAGESPPDAWIISAIDGPFLDYYVLAGSQRRYLPLARGLEFVDKPPFQIIQTAEQLHPAIASRLSSPAGASGAVLIDRWSLEFAESLPDFRREMDRAFDGFDLVPGGAGAPLDPSFYRLTPARPDHNLSAYALREGEPLAGSGPDVFVFETGVKRHVASLDAFTAHGLRWEDVRRLPDRVLAALPDGPPIT